MSNYTQTTSFGPKDSLISGDPNKLILGTQIDTELANIATAITSKYDSSNFTAAVPANKIGLSANAAGAASTYMRSDATIQLDVSIAPTWSGAHTFSAAGTALTVNNNATISGTGTIGTLSVTGNGTIGGTLGVSSSGSTLTGKVTINAATGQQALGLVGVAGQWALNVQGEPYGVLINAGTSSGDSALAVRDQTATKNYFEIVGDGTVLVVDDGGTMQTVGYRGMPLNSQNASYTLQLSDRGKAIYYGASTGTITVPASVFSAGDIASVLMAAASGSVTIAPGAGFSLYYANGSGLSSASRTLATAGIATIVFISSNSAFITGSGLS